MEQRDCSFVAEEGWFRYRACAIIVADGKVLVAKNDRDPYYYSVGGGVHLHETAEDAVLREVWEETGVHYEVDRLAFIHENFFAEKMTGEKHPCHELAFYFVMKPNDARIFDNQSFTKAASKSMSAGCRLKSWISTRSIRNFIKTTFSACLTKLNILLRAKAFDLKTKPKIAYYNAP